MPDIRPLSASLQAKAIAELNEVPSRLDEDIATLRTWIENQPHLNARTNDQFLVAFLRGCKFNIENAQEKIDKYYTLRTTHENLLTCRNVEDPRVLEILSLGIGLILPNPLGEDGPRIMITRTGHYSPGKYSMMEISRINAAIQDILLHEDDSVIVSGYIQILDFSQISSAHFFQFNPSYMKKFSAFIEEALPVRHHSSHFINTPAGFETVFNTFKPLMPTQMQEKLYIHGSNLENLYKFIPQKYLPIEYGGENGSVQEIIDSWTKNVISHAEFFRDDAKYRTDEKLKPGKQAGIIENIWNFIKW